MTVTIPDSTSIFAPFRSELAAWKQDRPASFYLDDVNLQSALKFWAGPERTAGFAPRLAHVGADAAGDLDRWAIETNRDEHLPRLARYDGIGERTEEVVFHPLYHEMGRRIYRSGIMSMYADPGNDLIQLAMFYLYAHNGEAGHCCPLACTAGAIKLIAAAGSAEVKAEYLPRLLDPDYDTHLHAAQFLTEVQGGSDVGANATLAVPQADGTWRLYGEKWFCSVIDAGLMVLTARPASAPGGTRGLMAFVAPRRLPDGRPNHFTVRRLKYKVGTRSMASAEIDLEGLVAHAVGGEGEGFKLVVDIVLNTSRLYNGFAAAAMTRRAWLEARSFARRRQAFGARIDGFPLIRRSLARLRCEAAAQLATSMHTAWLAEQIARGTAGKEDRQEFRFLVNANKYWTSLRCTRAVREAIEVLGGNGTIEEFSVLPRLYRDAIVIESWEGTHDVLCQQVLRDMGRYGVHEPVLTRAAQRLAARPGSEALARQLERCREMAAELLALPPDEAALHVRTFLDRTMPVLQCCDLLAEADAEEERGEPTGKAKLAAYWLLWAIERADPFRNRAFAELEERLAS